MIRTWTLVLIYFMCTAGQTATANAQHVFINSGFVLGADASDGQAASAVLHVGSRFALTDLLHAGAGLTYEQGVALGGDLHIRPFSGFGNVVPYAFAGFNAYVSGEARRSAVPAGAGVLYEISDRVALSLELAGRWLLEKAPGARGDIHFGIMPRAGAVVRLSSLGPLFTRALRDNDSSPSLGTDSPHPAGDDGTPDSPRITGENDRTSDSPRATGEVEGATASPASSPRTRPGIQQPPASPASVRAATQALRLSDSRDTLRLPTRENMVLVPDGTYIMGLADEDPLSLQTAGFKRVTVSGFYIDKFEVSNQAYRSFLAELSPAERDAMRPDSTVWEHTGNRFSWGVYFRGDAFDNYPVVAVNYDQASSFCGFYGKRLPTEAEWEYSARSGQIGGIYPWPGLDPRNDAGEFMANYNPGRGGYAADGYAFTAPVDAFPPTPWALYNMSGNVAEWVQDSYNPSYAVLSDFNPVYNDPNESRHVVRGGSWASDAFFIEVGIRDQQRKDEGSAYVGLRCVQDVSGLN